MVYGHLICEHSLLFPSLSAKTLICASIIRFGQLSAITSQLIVNLTCTTHQLQFRVERVSHLYYTLTLHLINFCVENAIQTISSHFRPRKVGVQKETMLQLLVPTIERGPGTV